MGVNDYQIDGDHYRNKKYQHWDFVCDTGMHYLLACATKYVSRWREKNGVSDLRKSLHYISKAIDKNVKAINVGHTTRRRYISDHIRVFIKQYPLADERILLMICMGSFDGATEAINKLIRENE